jgi:branched-chain amino acid transport system substrate-binding protein
MGLDMSDLRSMSFLKAVNLHGRFRLFLAVVLVAAVAIGHAHMARAQSSTAQAQGVTDQEIVVGAFGPLTGPSAWIGLSARDGINLALNEINQHGGINGRQLRLIFDGAQTPAEALATAKKLVEQDKVFVIVLGSGSTGAAAAADYLREVGIPTYNIVGATPKIRQPFGRNIFHGVYPDAGVLADYFAEEIARTQPKPKTAGVVVGSYELPQAEYKALVPRLEKLGIAVTTTQTFDLGTKDFTAQLVALTTQRPDVVVFLGNGAETGLAIKQGPEVGLSGLPWVIDVAGISRSVPQVAGAAAEGVRSTWMFPYFHEEPVPVMQEFERKWRAAYGEPGAGRPSYVDLNGYGDLYVLAYALRETGHDLTWDKLIAKWETLKNVKPSSFGPFASDVIFPESFSATERDGNTKYATVEIVKGVWKVVH